MGDQMTKFVSLHNNLHRHIRVDQRRIEAQGAKERMVPVVMSEFLKLAVQYPIAFTKYSDTGRFVCVALLGFEEHENLFWDGERWQGIYTPLNIVRQPFFVGQEDDKTVICIDAESDCLTREEGQAIFTEQGEETEFLRKVKAMLAQLIEGEQHTQTFIEALLQHKLLMPMSFNITFVNQQEQRVQGLYTIDEEKLSTLDDAAIALLHRQGYLKPIYTLIASLGHIYSLVEKKNARLADES